MQKGTINVQAENIFPSESWFQTQSMRQAN